MTEIPRRPESIENGTLILTLKPSTLCHYSCPHCYLSDAMRADAHLMSLEHIELIASKIKNYYETRSIDSVKIVVYLYGGEPTTMGIGYTRDMVAILRRMFDGPRYSLRFSMISSLVGVDLSVWAPFFKTELNGRIQTSYDGPMRGAKYVSVWERNVKSLVASGISVSSTTVINSTLLSHTGASVYDYLESIGITEISFLPFMLQERNAGARYNSLAPTMTEYSDFVISAYDRYRERCVARKNAPPIGQVEMFIRGINSADTMANMAIQTLFILPDGNVVLPDYKAGYKEHFESFGNILESSSFADILTSDARKRYLYKQLIRNGNPECASCRFRRNCIVEFAKPNRPGDSCFGAKPLLEHIVERGAFSSKERGFIH